MSSDPGPKKIVFTQAQLDDMEKLSAAGCTQQEIIDALGIASSTFYERKAEYPEISEAIRRGKSKGTATASKALMELVEAKYYPAIRFFLINRADDRWTDNPDSKKGQSQEDMEKLGQAFRLAFESARIIEGEVGPDE